MIDLEALRAAIRAHRQAGASWNQLAEGIGLHSRSVARWGYGGAPLDPRAVEAAESWLARGAPCPPARRWWRTRNMPPATREAISERLHAEIRRLLADGIQRQQIAVGIGVRSETVGWWLRSGACLTDLAAKARAWLDAGCPVGPPGYPGRKEQPVPWTLAELEAAGLLDPSISFAAVARNLGATENRLRWAARRLGVTLPSRVGGTAPRPRRERKAPGPTPDQLAWLARPGLPVCQWGSEAGSGVATPSRARACERAGWVEQVGSRKWRLTPAGRALVEASGVTAPEPEPAPVVSDARAALGWDVA